MEKKMWICVLEVQTQTHQNNKGHIFKAMQSYVIICCLAPVQLYKYFTSSLIYFEVFLSFPNDIGGLCQLGTHNSTVLGGCRLTEGHVN